MTRETTPRTRRTTALAGALCLAGLALAAPQATAKSPHTVDPSTLQPALNPDFEPWSCFRAGAGITCQGGYEASYDDSFGSCDGRELRVSGTIREFMTRWHTADGLATKTIVHLDAPADVFSLEGTDETVTLKSHWNRHYTYPVPGDRTTRVLTEVGNIYMGSHPGSGNILHDAGFVQFAPGADFEEIADSHGIHEWYDDPSVVERVVCDALT
jgi:hypothetical protein